MALPALASETELLSRAVGDLAQRTGFPVAFGGFETANMVEVTSVVGNRTQHLSGLVVHASRGLGGRALVEKRPRLALDYRSSRNITHDYDRAVLGEGISTLFAVPILLAGRARGVLYCGSWMPAPFGEGTARTALQVAGDLATELRVRDEVHKRLALLPAPTPSAPVPRVDAATREQLRETYAELRGIAADVPDASIRRRLSVLEARLSEMSRDDTEPAEVLDVRLSRRELDVLSCAALGQTNAEIAATLTLREGTVKSYLQSAMAKLDAGTRHAAVARARRGGLLP
ncbi:LuxR C-terminal-related transcriptional regulator [Microbacterium memoriense]|uniref:LuxR C-terminal-related transcriptional regulator n=1 Tax=Microbacterium memoriense TaxID=2978350 RepID=A0ABT2PA12_9MICO|nr:LuxR C-terminal-related transcriptional regulator [Microbacterium memoriense]MCT9001012.1 LuxR C-terminal-related transcriptional regulator [Microbacterium memoriense]